MTDQNDVFGPARQEPVDPGVDLRDRGLVRMRVDAIAGQHPLAAVLAECQRDRKRGDVVPGKLRRNRFDRLLVLVSERAMEEKRHGPVRQLPPGRFEIGEGGDTADLELHRLGQSAVRGHEFSSQG